MGLSIFTVNDVVFRFTSGVATQTGSNDACNPTTISALVRSHTQPVLHRSPLLVSCLLVKVRSHLLTLFSLDLILGQVHITWLIHVFYLKLHKKDNGYALFCAGHVSDVKLSLIPGSQSFYYILATCVPETRQSVDPYTVWLTSFKSWEVKMLYWVSF
jgi:hypothetical protein